MAVEVHLRAEEDTVKGRDIGLEVVVVVVVEVSGLREEV